MDTFKRKPESAMSIASPLSACLILGIVIAFAAFQARATIRRRLLLKGPLILAETDRKSRIQKWTANSREVLRSGYILLQKGLPLFRVTVEDGSELVILSSRYLDELKKLPDDTLSFEESLEVTTVTKYSHIGNLNSVGQRAVRSDLTPSLPRLMPAIASEARNALQENFPQNSADWTSVDAFEAALNAITQVSARLFVGQQLCRDPRWLSCSKNATVLAFKSIEVIKPWPSWTRPFIHRFLPELRQLETVRLEAKELLMEAAKKKQEHVGGQNKEDYLAEWVAAKNPKWSEDLAEQAALQLDLSVVAIHTTSMALTHMLYDLATHPEYIPMLREEIKTALAECGGEYNRDCIAKLIKTDSFMKESQRTNPPARTTFKRCVRKDVTFSDGTFLPKGTLLEIDSSVRYEDPKLWETPEQFDGLRFLRLREQTQEKSSHQFVTANSDYLFWGLGKHACPGRFFASNEIKTLLAMFLLEYDLSLPKGISQRPENLGFGSNIMPNPTAQLLVRKTKA
ncbi:hypothetical protein N0V90_012135 [Neofusicoccum parvum]|uniref:Uncharacterized protein n=1 Tax=Neofusicoccum parvum TaxID=310453 RepID=A0ACB5S3L8_9PEZI|nr:hypothetical protein N0V90_012135 [Neofusicoccum parvum]